jgi:glycosidase
VKSLSLVSEALEKAAKQGGRKRIRYSVPSLWKNARSGTRRAWVDPFEYYLSAIRRVQRTPVVRKVKGVRGEWSREAVVYNLFVRATTAFDHDGNGRIDLPVNPSGFRETGTFLKSIALLPFLRSLGMNTLHLLPITSIGRDGNKGTLGSPYAIRNSYDIEESLSEPVLGLGAAVEFRAFVEAAHRLGFRVVLEFVFRTAAKDSDWVPEHPEWFYWIREEIEPRENSSADEMRYGSPVFTREELDKIHHEVREHRFDSLIPPHDVYRDFFRPPPDKGNVEKINGRYRGTLPDGQKLKIPGAFADWPPDDNQPPWGDVTYLRMYDHPDFNYMAYNTIRMYDRRLSDPAHANTPLWDKVSGTIPFYQENFSIDGVMIDMGHALPIPLKKKMIARAREIDPEFSFWDENFSITGRSAEEGYNAVVGYLWSDEHHRDRMQDFLVKCSSQRFPISFFAGAETHNTPRAAARPGGVRFAAWSWVVNCFLPGIPFLHSGFELGETIPVNTGLDFTPAELAGLPAEKLPLFSQCQYAWLRKSTLIGLINRVCTIRKRFAGLITNPDPSSFLVLHDDNHSILAFARRGKDGTRIAIVTNANFVETERTSTQVASRKKTVVDLLTRKRLPLQDGVLPVKLKPGQCVVFEC